MAAQEEFAPNAAQKQNKKQRTLERVAEHYRNSQGLEISPEQAELLVEHHRKVREELLKLFLSSAGIDNFELREGTVTKVSKSVIDAVGQAVPFGGTVSSAVNSAISYFSDKDGSEKMSNVFDLAHRVGLSDPKALNAFIKDVATQLTEQRAGDLINMRDTKAVHKAAKEDCSIISHNIGKGKFSEDSDDRSISDAEDLLGEEEKSQESRQETAKDLAKDIVKSVESSRARKSPRAEVRPTTASVAVLHQGKGATH